ncbi:tetratricopeptide repeat protein [Sinomicrobium kalidii]|uniref:tetratricopeptide repeat protein n=1 Tax=Sinomicrobium kalidii TaxID=2900738 RepID=UPI001E477E26|nr:tetratricopeptide repeat protein [Sinomicrobium kalidii]UGU17807.1 tetratricopeptide repeat protein [Sinomicrobium kalidii]
MTVFSQHKSAVRPGNWIVPVLFLSVFLSRGQEQDREAEKTARISENLVSEANEELAGDNFEDAEVKYREAIAKNAENATARYNLGNAYYRKEKLGEAFTRFKQAGETAGTKKEKHKAYHNLGNVFMKNKEYQKAVEAYKEALRNDPTDEETRYNFALAKEMLKKNPPEDNKNDKDDKKEDQDKDKQDQNKDKQDQGGEGNKEDDQKDRNQGDEGDKDDQQPEKNKDQGNEDQGEDEKDQGQEGQPEEGEGEPRPGQSQLSPQQVQALLDAMSKEEKRVQDKINAKKAKGAKVKSEKDW